MHIDRLEYIEDKSDSTKLAVEELSNQFTDEVIDFRGLKQPGLGCDAPAISMLFDAKSHSRSRKSPSKHYLDLYSLNGQEDWRAFLRLIKSQTKPFTVVFTVRLGEGHFTANQIHITEDNKVFVLSVDPSPWYYSPKPFVNLLNEKFPDNVIYLTPKLPDDIFAIQPWFRRGEAALKSSMQTSWKDCRVFSAFYALLLSKPRNAKLVFEMKKHAAQDPNYPSLWHYSRDQLPKEFFRSAQTLSETDMADAAGGTSIDHRADQFKKRIRDTKFTSVNQTLFGRSGGTLLQNSTPLTKLSQVTIARAEDSQVIVTIHPRPLNGDIDDVPVDATPLREPAKWWNQSTVFQSKTNLGFKDIPNTTWANLSTEYANLTMEFTEQGDFIMKGPASDIQGACNSLLTSVRQNTFQYYKDGMSQILGSAMTLRYIIDQMNSLAESDAETATVQQVDNFINL